ncbi:hypothetical protein ID866_8043, partial [Astraeus odoratus]
MIDIPNQRASIRQTGAIPSYVHSIRQKALPDVPSQSIVLSIDADNAADQLLDSTNPSIHLSKFLTVVNTIGIIHPFAQTALNNLSIACQIILSQENYDDSIQGLLSKLNETYKFLLEGDTILKMSVMRDTMNQVAAVVEESAEFIATCSEDLSVRSGMNVLSETNVKVIQYNAKLDLLMQQFRDRQLQDVYPTTQQPIDDHIIDKLSCADKVGASTAKKCLKGTRNKVLEQIKNWVDRNDADTPRIFWLHGQAGRGKSAISHTISLWAEDRGMAGSYFFFDRSRCGEKLHEKLFSTIARDLAVHVPLLKRYLVDTLSKHPTLKDTTDILKQWEKLVSEPLLKLDNWFETGKMVVVIDALDESGPKDTREDVLDILANEVAKLPQNFRILLTSRPLGEMIGVFQSKAHIKMVSLDDIPAESMNNDVRQYISAKMEKIHLHYRNEDIDKLVEKSSGLFEWVRLACAYIEPKAGRDPQQRLRALLSQDSGTSGTLLDEMYKTFLMDIVGTSPDTLLPFRSVMQQILYTLEPLPISSLHAMRNGFRYQQHSLHVEDILDYMAPLLSGITNHSAPVHPLHASFYDFLTDKQRSGIFFVEECDTIHQNLAISCLYTMGGGLRFNICSLDNSHLLNSQVHDMAERISANIAPELSYTCRLWATHLLRAKFDLALADSLATFFDGEQILFWLEVLSLLR